MPRVSDQHRQAQRERIIDAALSVAADKGLANISMSEVIRQSGLSAGAIYGYFDGKDAIVAAAAQSVILSRAEAFVEATERLLPPAETLRLVVEHFPGPRLNAGLVVQIWGEAPTSPALREAASAGVRTITASFRDYLAAWYQHGRGLDAEDARRRAAQMVPALIGLVQGWFVTAHLQLTPLDDYLAAVDLLLADA